MLVSHLNHLVVKFFDCCLEFSDSFLDKTNEVVITLFLSY